MGARDVIRRHRAAIAAASVIVLAVLAVVAVKLVRARNAAQARARDVGAIDQLGADVRAQLSRLYEAQGRRRLLEGEVDPALVYLAEAYELADRPSLRFSLARGLAALDGAGSIRVDVADERIGFAFSPASTLLAIAGREGVALWDAETGRRAATLATERPITAFAWNPDPQAEQLLIASEDGVRFWSPNGRTSAVDGVGGRVTHIAWGTHPRAVVEEGERVVLSELSIPRSVVPLARAPLAIDRNGELALVCPATCELVGVARNTPIALVAKHAAFSPDGKRVAIATATHLHVLDVDGTERARLAGTFGPPTFSADGARIAAPDATAARLWDASSGALLATIAVPAITWLQLTPDARLVTIAADLRIWDAETGSLLHTEAIAAPIERAALSHDGTRLATWALGASQLRIWDLAEERRTPAQVRALVRCRVALALVDGRVQPRAPAPADCAK